MKAILVSDLGIQDYPFGGGEQVNDYICRELYIPFVKASNVTSYNPSITYIISSCYSMSPIIRDNIIKGGNYIIIEHDYKFVANRNPKQYSVTIGNHEYKNMVPDEFKVNLDYYRNARMLFCQTKFHYNIFDLNNIVPPGKITHFVSSIWSKGDIGFLREITGKVPKNGDFVIHNHIFDLKNTKGAIKYCVDRKLSYKLIDNQPSREEFLYQLSKYSALVFFPLTPETCSRICLEARCINMNVLCNNDFGCTVEDWFSISGHDMINFLESNTQKNIEMIRKFI